MNSFSKANGAAENWLVSFTKTLRGALPAGQYLITHAREYSRLTEKIMLDISDRFFLIIALAPWFSPKYTAGAYTAVHKRAGGLIDWYNVQFYNQNEYTNCAGLLTASSSTFPKTSVFEIAHTAGVPLDKIVIGKPGTRADANNGYIAPATLAGCVAEAKSKGWNGGVMVWQFPSVGSGWVKTVRGSAWPVGGAHGSHPARDESTSNEPASDDGDSCSVPAWSNSTVYEAGETVFLDGSVYEALYENENEKPGMWHLKSKSKTSG